MTVMTVRYGLSVLEGTAVQYRLTVFGHLYSEFYDFCTAEFMANQWSLPMQPAYGWTEHELNLKVVLLVGGIRVMAGRSGCSK